MELQYFGRRACVVKLVFHLGLGGKISLHLAAQHTAAAFTPGVREEYNY